MENEDLPVVVFRSESLEETGEVAALFEQHDVACSVDREAGAGYAELTDFDAVEDAPCWAISVVESQAPAAERLMADEGVQSMVDPGLLSSAPTPWSVRFWRAVVIGWLVILAMAVILLASEVL